MRVRLRPGLALLLPLRGATHVVPADSYLEIGTRRVNLDRLPRDLARLVPHAYARADAVAFEPLLRAIEGRN